MVGSSYPGGAVPSKGRAVRPLKGYASWVQNVGDTAFNNSNVVLVLAVSVKPKIVFRTRLW